MMSAIQQNQKVLFENQQNILKGLAKINTKLDEYFTRSQGPFQQERQEQPSHFKIITNIDELTNFEEQLKCPLMVSKYFEQLSIICRHKKSAQNNAYALVDSMFDRKLMTCCSWGGGSKGEPKHCFKAFSKTIDLFLKVVHQYDETFTKPNCVDFFKNVMRHSTKRNKAKRVRNSTTKKKNKNRAAENQLQDADRPDQGLPNISDQTKLAYYLLHFCGRH
ncbi:uncharacterized protein LOC126913018 [Spodoptera frugiperda]|uniref:Uncharacterized protein LOC126913018 n=1 Tax=Spodoptera frugiperda TaxID=7108 RepID=A0A9R0F7N0_SPOFR|nr:uncharacterized protein LOC126913018 [Spodoptera frugiperda]